MAPTSLWWHRLLQQRLPVFGVAVEFRTLGLKECVEGFGPVAERLALRGRGCHIG